MRPRVLIAALALPLVFCVSAAQAEDPSIERMRKDLLFLTSEECEGRGAQTQGLNKAADYIAQEFKKIGLKPGGPKDSYFQPYTMQTGRAKVGAGNSVRLTGPLGQQIELEPGQHFETVGLSVSGKLTAPVVFVGYGLSVPDLKYDDYAGIDVTGKIVIVMRKTPMPGSDHAKFGGERNARIASLTEKVLTADQKKAAAILFVNDRDTISGFLGDRLMPFDYTSEADVPAKIPSVHVRRSVVDMMLQSVLGRDFRSVESEIDRTLSPQSALLKGWTATIDVTVERKMADVKNVIAVLPGQGPLAKETVIIGAHYDHLGRGERGSLERDTKRKTLIHHGADDNGSGTTAVLELARRYASQKDYQGRTLVFMTFSGEEQGLLGSVHFCAHPTVPLTETAAMVNLDMVGRVRADDKTKKDKIEIGGIGTAKEFSSLIDEINKKYDFQVSKTASGFGPSDHTSFARKRVPVFFFFTGMHQEYHRPADTIDTINFAGLKKVVDMCGDLVGRLANQKEKPVYVQTSAPAQSSTGRGDMPRLGIMPGNYNDAEERGVAVGGVIDKGPAQKAGLKEGDLILEIAGKPVKNMVAYMSVLASQKRGQPLELLIERKGVKQKVSITPE